MGSIMAVVAVLEIHMERNMVVNMKPSISLAWEQPTIMMILKATLLCNPQCSTAMAMIKPPRNWRKDKIKNDPEEKTDHVVGGVEIIDRHFSC